MTAANRMIALRHAMAGAGTDLLALAPGAHMRWLLGFTPHPDERLCLLLVGPNAAGFVMPALNADDARQHTDLPFATWDDANGPDAALAAMLARVCPVPPNSLSLDETMRADHALALIDRLPDTARGFASREVGALRLIKQADELDRLAENAHIADAAQEAVRASLKPGVTESQMAQVARDAFAAHGAQGLFATIAFGPNSALPHHASGDRVLADGDVVLVDIGGRRGDYVSDITRMVSLGPPPAGYDAVHTVVEGAVQAALAAIRPGVAAHTIDDAARGVIERAGYGAHFTHRTGHGLGIEVHEMPWMTATNTQTLQEGMVFTVEPGIYLPGRFGIRLEEVAVVTADGVRILSNLPRALHTV